MPVFRVEIEAPNGTRGYHNEEGSSQWEVAKTAHLAMAMTNAMSLNPGRVISVIPTDEPVCEEIVIIKVGEGQDDLKEGQKI